MFFSSVVKADYSSVLEFPEGAKCLEVLCESLQKLTQFQSFKELATLAYGDTTGNCSVVASIDFDRDGEYFACAGVTKKIKVYSVAVSSLFIVLPYPLRCSSTGVL